MNNRTFQGNLKDKSSTEYKEEKKWFMDGLLFLLSQLEIDFVDIGNVEIQFDQTEDCRVRFLTTLPWNEERPSGDREGTDSK